jgi:predicted ester cyclase
MPSIKETARQLFDTCESGKGWEACKPFCHEKATFSAQADALTEIKTLEAYAEWMKGMYSIAPDSSYQIRSFAVDDEHENVMGYGVFRATHTNEGGPVPPTGKSVEAEYVYIMQFKGDKISHMTKVWNDGHSMRQIGWA